MSTLNNKDKQYFLEHSINKLVNYLSAYGFTSPKTQNFEPTAQTTNRSIINRVLNDFTILLKMTC
jgi:hypothetical protein